MALVVGDDQLLLQLNLVAERLHVEVDGTDHYRRRRVLEERVVGLRPDKTRDARVCNSTYMY